MKQSKGKKKFQTRVFIYSLLIISLIITTIAFFTISYSNLTNQYHSSYVLYEYIGNFYEEQSNSHDYIKNYLYTGNEKEYKDYKYSHEIAKQSLIDIQKNQSLEENVWRIGLLMNMLDSYQEQVERVVLLEDSQDETYGTAYDKLLEINDLILKTSDDYYQMITEVMNTTLRHIDHNKEMIKTYFIVIGILSVVGVILYAWIIRKSIVKPIDELVDNMEDIKKGTFDFKQVNINNAELEVLSLALQDLSDNIHKNIEYEKEKSELKNKLLLKENESLRKDELLVSSELKILRNQINPHFLFNAMNMIYQQAILEKADTTNKMIEKMTECMRYTLGQNSSTSTLNLELNFVKNYIYIQNKRFEGRIHFELVIDGNLPNIRIPSMIIEPLIDNSVKHGLANTEADGLVSIHVSSDDKYIFINVSDNGCGMDSQNLEKLVMNEFRIEKQDENVGLCNLSRRLLMYYSDQASITINSVEDCGFETLISIPI